MLSPYVPIKASIYTFSDSYVWWHRAIYTFGLLVFETANNESQPPMNHMNPEYLDCWLFSEPMNLAETIGIRNHRFSQRISHRFCLSNPSPASSPRFFRAEQTSIKAAKRIIPSIINESFLTPPGGLINQKQLDGLPKSTTWFNFSI